MKLLCLLVAFGVAVTAEGPVRSSYNGPTIEEARHLANALENHLQELDADLSATLTLLAVGDERLNNIRDSFKPANALQNSQQDSLIEYYRAQAKALRHRVDDAVVGESAAKALAVSTQTAAIEILEHINGTGPVTIEKDNDKQDTLLFSLNQKLTSAKSDFLSNLQSVLDTLGSSQQSAEGAITNLGNVVDSQKCEYGTASIEAGSATKWIPFKTNFTSKPQVVLTLTGFAADLEDSKGKGYGQGYEYKGINVLRSEKYFFDVDTRGFSMVVDPLRDNEADLKRVHCSWMACQNFEATHGLGNKH